MLRAGVIAAGWGERLRSSNQAQPKALTSVSGRPLIEHVLRSVQEAGADEVVTIINEASLSVRDYVESLGLPVKTRWITETTESSMHSFLRVLETLAEASSTPCLMTTVDTIAPPGAYSRFARFARALPDADLVLALTDHVDDEKPLMVAVDEGRVRGIGEYGVAGTKYATAGYYWVHPRVLREAEVARARGFLALRKFLGHLFAKGYQLYGIPMPRSIDVDRPADIEVAESFLLEVSP